MCGGLLIPAAMQPTILSSCLFFMLTILLGCKSNTAESSGNPELCIVSSLVTPYFVPLLDTPRKTRGCSTSYKSATAQTHSKSQSHHVENKEIHVMAQNVHHMQEVHVIMLHSVTSSFLISHRLKSQTPSPVKLSVNFSQDEEVNESNADVLGRLILVLNSDHPVAWELVANYNNKEDTSDDSYSSPQPLILVSEGSTVEGNFKFNFSHKRWPNKKALQRYVRRDYPLLASYTEVKGANHLELKVGSILSLSQNPSLGTECNIDSLTESRVLTAYSTVQLKTEGCFHEDYIGDNQVDVYVVELDAGAKGNRPNRGPLPVLIQLQGEGMRPVPRNVTLILKSHQPIRWQFGANGINGNIIVVSDHEDLVENSAVGGHQNLEVRSKPLPDNLPELLLSVTTEFAPPILYAKTGRASTLRLLVGSTRNKAGLRSGPEMHNITKMKVSEGIIAKQGRWNEYEKKEELKANTGNHELMQQQPNYPGATLVSGFTAQEPQPSALVRLAAAMTVECGKSRIVASFPASLIHELGVTHLTLNDASCVSQSNGTHVLLSSLITSCGSTGDSDGRVVSTTNFIHVTFGPEDESDDEDFEESSGWYGEGSLALGKIPIICKDRPHFPVSKPGLGNAEDPLIGSEDILNSGSSSKMTLYHMELYRDKEHTEALDFSSPDPSVREAEFDETLYVRAWIDGVFPVQVVTENCWISNSSNPRESSRVILLRNTCPVDLSVEIQAQIDAANNSQNQYASHGSFSFQVNKEYGNLGQFFVHCRLGLCTSDPAHIRGNLIRCVDPKKYCSRQSLRPYLDKTVSTAQQLASKGPLRPVPRRRRVPSLQVALNTESPAEGQPKIAYVGVSTEVTVGIALASFAIGVGLTGALWYIHMKTDPFRRQTDKQLPEARTGVGTSVVTGCNLSPHSGCSSTNSEAAMTAT